eukprot:8301114-Ditylum_brightwellii.AAC.1
MHPVTQLHHQIHSLVSPTRLWLSSEQALVAAQAPEDYKGDQYGGSHMGQNNNCRSCHGSEPA